MGKLFDSPLHLLILLLVVVLLFGAKKLPDLSRSVARSMRIFKSEVREMKEEDRAGTPSTTSTAGGRAHTLEGKVVDASPRASEPSVAESTEQQRHSA